MDSLVNLYCFGTFGSPNGYKHTLCFGRKETITVCNSFDLNTNAIKLTEGAKLFSIKKGSFNNKPSLVFSIYFHAFELNSNREGTFIGCSVICIEYFPDVPSIMKTLYEYLDQLKNLNTQNSRFTVSHSDSFKLPPLSIKETISKLELNKIPLFESSKNSSETKLLINCDLKELKQQWNESIFLLNKYSEIFFSANPDLTNFVRKKNLYQVITHTKEKPQLTTTIEHLKKERSDKIEQKKQNYLNIKESYRNKIEHQLYSIDILYNRKQQERNSYESDLSKLTKYKSELVQFKKDVDDVFEKILKGISNSNSNQKSDSSLYQKYNNQLNEISDFIERLNTDSRRNEDIRRNHIPKPITKTPSEVEYENNGFGYFNFELVSIILAILLIGSWSYFLFFYEPDIPENYTRQKEIQGTGGGQSVQEFLNESDLSIVNKKLKRGMTLDTIVSIVFKNNPNDIESHYSSKKEIYKDLLIYSNEDLFKKVNLDYILDADALKKVPCKK
jgi:hypothetical protein